MIIILKFTDETTTTTEVSKAFTNDMINECFLNKDFNGMGVVASVCKHF